MTTTVALVLFRQPEIAFFYALLPFLAVVTLHWWAGLLAEGLIVLLLTWLAQDPSLHLSPAYLFAITCGGLITGLFGWISYSTLLTVAEWSFSSFTQARHYMEEAQNHRAQLATMVKDLDQAYYRLERSNAALVAARKVAEDAEHFKTEFITHVSHEIRTPLNLIVGFSDVMLTAPESYDGLVLPGPYRSDLVAIKRSAQHLLDLTEDILNLARIEIGKTTLGSVRQSGFVVSHLLQMLRKSCTKEAASWCDATNSLMSNLRFLSPIFRQAVRLDILGTIIGAS